MLPIIEKEVVDNKNWLSRDEFLEMLAISQSSPGPVSINISIFCGLKIKKAKGAFCTLLGCILPSFIVILLVAIVFSGIETHPITIKIFNGIRPAVVALIAVPIINLAKTSKVTLKNVWIPIITAFLVAFLNINPIYIISLAIIAGIILNQKIQKAKENATD